MDELLAILRAHAARYPLMQPCDAVKLLYQNEFGGGHLIADPERSLARIREEAAAFAPCPLSPDFEDIGGGLVRAYSHTASIALQAAGVITMRECLMLSLTCDYGQYGRVASLVPECGGVTDDTIFEEKVTVRFHMAPEALGGFAKKLADATNGQVTVEETGKKYFEFQE